MMDVVRTVTGIAALLGIAIAVILPEVRATRWIVGANKGWSPDVNYQVWAQDKHFYDGDWLFFVYDRNQMNVLEVNSTDYESCNSKHPLHNWTTGAGRDVVPLNQTRTYYFVSGKGFCSKGMKVAIKVENLPPPSSTSPVNSTSPPTYGASPPFGSPADSEAPMAYQLSPPFASPLRSRSPSLTYSASPPSASPTKSSPAPTHQVNPPSASPVKSGSPYVIAIVPAVFTIGAVLDVHFL